MKASQTLPFATTILPTLCVAEGAAEKEEAEREVPIAKLEFEGNRAFSSQELLEVLSKCVLKDDAPRLIYEERRFEYCVGYKLLNHMRDHGYLQAKVSGPKKREMEDGLEVTLRVEEGPRFRLGNTKIDGVTIFPLDRVRETLKLKPGEVAGRSGLLEGLEERLKRAYGERGHVQYDYDVEPAFGAVTDAAGDGTVDFIITVYEGPAFKVRRIEFEGNATTRDDVLRREVSLKEDETFNQTLLEESIERLNALGLFEEIDWRKDVDMRADEAKEFLDLRIKVKEKKPG